MEPDSESKTGLHGNPETYEIMESNQNDIEYYVVEEARGFNTDTYTKLISQMHMYTQLLGQGVLMARHHGPWTADYFDMNSQSGNMLHQIDKSLFDFMDDLTNLQNGDLLEINEVIQHAESIRDQAFFTPTDQSAPGQQYEILSDPTRMVIVTSRMFPFHELFPKINKVWFDEDPFFTERKMQLNSWRSGHVLSPGEENLLFLYYLQYSNDNHPKNGAIKASSAQFIDYLRSEQLMTHRSDSCLTKAYRNLMRRKKNPVDQYRQSGVLPRSSIIQNIKDQCYIEFRSLDEQLQDGSLGTFSNL